MDSKGYRTKKGKRKMNDCVEEQVKIISKGASNIIGIEELRLKIEQSIENKTPLVIKLGLDPSAPDIHLGHAVVLRKIKQMQDLGHRAVIVIGDFTGKIGDPTGKLKGRKALTNEEVLKNAKTYEEQIFKILDREKTEVRFNSEWLKNLAFKDVLELAGSTTVARMLEREDFKNRYNNNTPIGLHEFFYPLMQGYDSVYLKADIEMGGTDQTFNILMGRTLQKNFHIPEQVALFMPILEGLDGIEKMSKSLGNYIGIEEDAKVMFKKVMEVPDDLIIRYYELATDEHPDDIDQVKVLLSNGVNPRDIKINLAKTITGLYHSKIEVEEALEFYMEAFSKGAIPKNIPELLINWEKDRLIDIIPLFVKEQYVKSGSEFRRLLKQGGISINGEKTDNLDEVLFLGDVIKIGKKQFIKIIK